jgi:hypothetical protein
MRQNQFQRMLMHASMPSKIPMPPTRENGMELRDNDDVVPLYELLGSWRKFKHSSNDLEKNLLSKPRRAPLCVT